MTTLNPITALPTDLRDKLHRLRRAVRLYFLCEGLAWLFSIAAGLALLSLALDRLFRMDQPQRAVMLLMMLGALAWVAWRRLVRPLLMPLGHERLARAVEHRHPELADALLSALQFATGSHAAPAGASPALVRAAIAQGVRRAAPVRFDDVINQPARRRYLTITACVAGGFAVMVLLFPALFGRWAERNLLLADTPWPQNTHLTIAGVRDGTLIAPRGDDLTVTVNVRGTIPPMVELDVIPEDGRRTTEQMRQRGDDQFVTTFRNVIQPSRLRARGGDEPGRWIQLQLVDRPDILRDQAPPEQRIHGLTLHVKPPDYTDLPEQHLPFGQAAYEIPVGSTVTVEAFATKPIADARIRFEDDWQQALNIAPAPEQRIHRAPDPDKPRPITYPPGPRRLTGTIPPEQLRTGAYRVTMTDADGLAARHPVRLNLRVQEDRPPSIRVVRRGIGDMVTPQAVLPLRIEMSDDFALTDAHLVYTTTPLNEQAATEPEALDIPELDDSLPAAEPAPFVHRLQAQRLMLNPGSVLSLRVRATDNDAHNPGGPKQGTSPEIGFKVVTPTELRAELLRREQEQRMEFERVVETQQQTSVDTRALAAALKRGDPFDAEARRTLVNLEKQQRLAAGRSQTIAEAFDQILAEVLNNRLEAEGGPLQRRLERRILQPLRDLAAGPVPDAADALDRATAATIDADQRRALLDEAIARQQALLRTMRDILDNMRKLEGYQEAINLLRELIRRQEDISEQTREEMESRIEDIFE